VKVISQSKASWPAIVVGLAAALSMLFALIGPGAADAQAPPKSERANCSTGRTVPANKISIQLWTFNRYIDAGQGVAPPGETVGATRAERLEQVLRFLSEVGYRNIEPFSFHGLTVQQFDADAKLLGQHWTGSGGFASPGTGSYQNTLATAATMNRLGERSVKNGTGRIFGHNHDGEFRTRYVDTQGDGQLKSAWQILVENTDPRYVDFQLDVGWAVIGGEDPVALIEQFGDRIELLHVKDVADIASRTQTTVGQGIVDWRAVFAAAQGHVKQYVIEQDPPVEPFSFAAESFRYVDCLTF
jgi:Xylose isomerase-like TIM barrel